MWDFWLNDYKDELLSSEVVAADKGYQGALRCYTLYKASKGLSLIKSQKQFNFRFGQCRCFVEQSIGRIKKFRIAKDVWRHSLAKHCMVVHVLCGLVNESLQEDPLRKANNFLYQ